MFLWFCHGIHQTVTTFVKEIPQVQLAYSPHDQQSTKSSCPLHPRNREEKECEWEAEFWHSAISYSKKTLLVRVYNCVSLVFCLIHVIFSIYHGQTKSFLQTQKGNRHKLSKQSYSVSFNAIFLIVENLFCHFVFEYPNETCRQHPPRYKMSKVYMITKCH